MIVVELEKCTGCGLCIKSCSFGALEVVDKKAVFTEERCTLCGICISACPTGAISMERKARTADVSAYKDVWVFAEQKDGKLKNVAIELLGKGRELADELHERLCAVVFGKDINDLYKTLASYGADAVYAMDTDVLSDYSSDAYRSAITILITKYKPNLLLFGATHMGRDLAPSVAAHIGLGLTADCTGLSITDDGLLLQTRPAFGGNLMADILTPNTRPQMATVRPNVMKRPEPEEGRECEVIEEDFHIHPRNIRTEILEVITGAVEGEKPVEEADIIVSGGRGVGAPEGFEVIRELARALKGTIGCSRPIVELGWMPKSRQVGQSGKTVSPTLYVACGISGAIQHKVGIRNSDIIIAINKDRQAPIFEIANLGVVGDIFKILPPLIEELRKNAE